MQPHGVEKPRKRRSGFTAVFGVIMLGAIAVAVLAWYGVPALQRSDVSLARLPVVQKALDAFNLRVQNTEEKMGNLERDRESLADQIARVKNELAARVGAVQQRARQSGEAIYSHVQSQIDNQVEAVRTRLLSLESGVRKSDTQVATLQEELKQVKSEIQTRVADLDEELARVRTQVNDTTDRHDRAIGAVRDDYERNRADVRAIENRLAVDRVDFEVTKDHSRELAPGFSLGVTGIDVAYRRMHGWLWLKSDGRTIFLQSQSAQEPVIFYGNKDGLKRELVITNVTREGVAGYLLLPRQVAAAAAAGDGPAEE